MATIERIRAAADELRSEAARVVRNLGPEAIEAACKLPAIVASDIAQAETLIVGSDDLRAIEADLHDMTVRIGAGLDAWVASFSADPPAPAEPLAAAAAAIPAAPTAQADQEAAPRAQSCTDASDAPAREAAAEPVSETPADPRAEGQTETPAETPADGHAEGGS